MAAVRARTAVVAVIVLSLLGVFIRSAVKPTPRPPARPSQPTQPAALQKAAAEDRSLALPAFARSSGATAVADPSSPFNGLYFDRSINGPARVVVTPSGKVYARRMCWLPEEGTATGSTLTLFAQRASLVGSELRWSNGVVWDKKNSNVPEIEVPQQVSLPALPAECPGRDPAVYVSKSAVPFYLCTHGNADLVSSHFIRSGWWDDCLLLPVLIKLLRQVRPGVQLEAVDVGGNIGTCSMVLASEGVNVTTFEPAPINYKLVEKSIELNAGRFPAGGRVTLHRAGAGSERTSAVVQNEEGNFGHGVVQKQKTELKYLINGKQPRLIDAPVQLTRLDDEVHHHVHLLKMDCQGHEIEVLLGARALMMQHGVDIVRTEFNSGLLQLSGHKPERLLELFDEYGYTVVVEGKRLPPAKFSAFAFQHRKGEAEVFAVNKEIIPEENWECLR